MLEPVSISVLEIVELNADDAREGGTDGSAGQRIFGQTGREEVDVVHGPSEGVVWLVSNQISQMIIVNLLVETLETLSLRGRHVLIELVPVVNLFVEAKLKIIGVATNAMVTATLNVEGGQVEAVGIVLGTIQMILHVRRDEGVAILGGLTDQTTDHSIELTFVETKWVEEEFSQPIARSLAVGHDLGKDAVDQRMSKSEGGRRKLVDDARIGVRIVFGVAFVLNIQLEVFHRIGTENDRQPFFVGDRLDLSSNDTSVRCIKRNKISVDVKH